MYHRWHAICCTIYTCIANCVSPDRCDSKISFLGHHATGRRTGTSCLMTHDLLYYIYMYCELRVTYPEQVSKWISEGTHPDQKVAKMRFQHFSYRWLSTWSLSADADVPSTSWTRDRMSLVVVKPPTLCSYRPPFSFPPPTLWYERPSLWI